MKKILALVLVLMMMLVAAYAESAEFVDVVFEDGFKVALPGDWLEIELSEEDNAGGIFYCAASPDGENTLQISWYALDAEMTIEELQAAYAIEYADAQIFDFNGIAFVGHSDAENSLIAYSALDAAEPGVYTFWFTSTTFDDAFTLTAAQILASIGNVEI